MRSSVLVITVTLVCSAMALPSPSTEESEGVRPKRQNPNTWDGPHSIQCATGYGLYEVHSRHDNGKEDRIFDYRCRYVTSTSNVNNCYWTGYVNNYDEPFAFQCPAGQYLAGTASQHSNSREDRQFKFRCCTGKALRSESCFLTGFKNDWDAAFTYTAGSGYTFAGVSSYHRNDKE